MKKTYTFTGETQEQKEARWAKNIKNAKTFARIAGLDKKAISERKRIQKEQAKAKGLA